MENLEWTNSSVDHAQSVSFVQCFHYQTSTFVFAHVFTWHVIYDLLFHDIGLKQIKRNLEQNETKNMECGINSKVIWKN